MHFKMSIHTFLVNGQTFSEVCNKRLYKPNPWLSAQASATHKGYLRCFCKAQNQSRFTISVSRSMAKWHSPRVRMLCQSENFYVFQLSANKVRPLRVRHVKPLAFLPLSTFCVLSMTIGKEVRHPKIPNWACFMFSSWKHFFEFETKNRAVGVPEDKKLNKVNPSWSP
jgi:hypothetical protein